MKSWKGMGKKMREILFRGKRIDNGEWAYGCVFDGGTIGSERMFVGDIVVTDYEGTADDRYNIEGVGVYEVGTDTICQYTGLNDKNGKKIFDGDIISTPKYGISDGKGHNFSGKDKFFVDYADGTYQLKNNQRVFCLRPDSACEVIGNIFDNPELLH